MIKKNNINNKTRRLKMTYISIKQIIAEIEKLTEAEIEELDINDFERIAD
jgi:hypothetical protein